ncbi:MAG TPA: solute carrier family 23 protein [Acetobacteraceae bacterium]
MSGNEESGAYQRPTNLTYALYERPPAGKLLLLGLQYAVLDAVYLVLVAIIVRHSDATSEERITLMGISCVALAIGTVLQALPRGPVGSGFMAPPVFSATYMGPSVAAAEVGGMRLVFGMTIIAGLIETLIAFCLHRLRIIITPVVSGMTVFIVGLQLGIIGIGEVLDVEHEMLPVFPIHLMVTISTLALCMALSIWGRGVWKLVCSIIGLGFGMAAASVVGLIDAERLAAVANSAWIELPRPSLFDHGFNIGLLPAFIAAGAAAAFRAVGVVTTAQRMNNAAWRHPDMSNIRKGLLSDGLANVAGGLLGTAGMSISPSIVGVSGTTGATSRVIAFAASAYLLVLGFSPRLAGIFLLIPPEVAGSMMVFSACFLIASGMQLILSPPVDARAIYVIGISTLLALSENLFPAYFQRLPAAVHSLTASPLAIGLTAAVVLTLVFRLGTRQRDTIAWDDSDTARADVTDSLRKIFEAWRIAPEIIERSLRNMQSVVEFLRQNQLHSGSVTATYNGIELRTEIAYAGVHEPPVQARTTVPIRERLDAFANEEEVAFIGLRDFLRSMAADRKRVWRRQGHLTVRLSYEIP